MEWLRLLMIHTRIFRVPFSWMPTQLQEVVPSHDWPAETKTSLQHHKVQVMPKELNLGSVEIKNMIQYIFPMSR